MKTFQIPPCKYWIAFDRLPDNVRELTGWCEMNIKNPISVISPTSVITIGGTGCGIREIESALFIGFTTESDATLFRLSWDLGE